MRPLDALCAASEKGSDTASLWDNRAPVRRLTGRFSGSIFVQTGYELSSGKCIGNVRNVGLVIPHNSVDNRYHLSAGMSKRRHIRLTLRAFLLEVRPQCRIVLRIVYHRSERSVDTRLEGKFGRFSPFENITR